MAAVLLPLLLLLRPLLLLLLLLLGVESALLAVCRLGGTCRRATRVSRLGDGLAPMSGTGARAASASASASQQQQQQKLHSPQPSRADASNSARSNGREGDEERPPAAAAAAAAGSVGRSTPQGLFSASPELHHVNLKDDEQWGEALDQAMNYELRVMSGNSNPQLAEAIARNLNVKLMQADVKRFSDGEVFVSIKENVRGKDVFVVQGTAPPVNDNLVELLVMIDTLKRASAKRITAVMPYFGYARQDRKSAPRVPISARLVADLIETAGAHRVLAFELHAGQIQGFFGVPVDHMYAVPVFVDYLQHHAFGGLTDPVVVSPDAGGMERARALAKRVDASLAIIDKRRSGANVAHVMHIIGDVRARDCIIVDDMVDTAGTLTEAAGALKKHGARRVLAVIVHPILSGPAIQRLRDSEIDQLIVTDSVVVSAERRAASGDKILQLPVDQLFSDCIKRIHREQSVSSLFD